MSHSSKSLTALNMVAVAVLVFGVVGSYVDNASADEFDDAQQKYEVGDYSGAAELFSEDYKIWGNPKVLQNTALSYQAAGQPLKAYASLQLAISSEPRSENLRQMETILLSELSLQENNRGVVAGLLSKREMFVLAICLLALLGIILYLTIRTKRHKMAMASTIFVLAAVSFLIYKRNKVPDRCLIEESKLYTSASLDEEQGSEIDAGKCVTVVRRSRTAVKIKTDTTTGWISNKVLLDLRKRKS